MTTIPACYGMLIKGLWLYVSFTIVSNFFIKKNQISSTQVFNIKNKRRKSPYAKTCTVQMSCAVVWLLIRRRTTVVSCWLPCCRDVFHIFYPSLSAAGSCSAICDVPQLHGTVLQLLHGLICKEPNKQSTLFGEAHVWDDEYLRINTNMGKQNERASVVLLRSDAPRVLLPPCLLLSTLSFLCCGCDSRQRGHSCGAGGPLYPQTGARRHKENKPGKMPD